MTSSDYKILLALDDSSLDLVPKWPLFFVMTGGQSGSALWSTALDLGY